LGRSKQYGFDPIFRVILPISVSKTTMNANQLSSLAQRYGSYLLKAFGLFAVIYVVCAVTSARFETLREQSVGLPSGYISAAQRTRELDCLTRNIYWEAANEPFEGKVGVAQVTLNRVESGKFANSVCAVVYQKNVFYEKVVCQFSWFCESGNPSKAIHKPLWKESEEVAKKVLLEGFRLPSLKDALYYHADYVNPGWKKPKLEKIGHHIFYGEKT
jgi:spore germination cell wall hydrolase CwlJ-like protein